MDAPQLDYGDMLAAQMAKRLESAEEEIEAMRWLARDAFDRIVEDQADPWGGDADLIRWQRDINRMWLMTQPGEIEIVPRGCTRERLAGFERVKRADCFRLIGFKLFRCGREGGF